MAEGISAGELVVKYVFNADTAKLNDFIRGIGELNMGSVLAGLGMGTLAETINLTAQYIGKLMEHGEGTSQWMKNFSAQTKLSAQEVKKWMGLADEFGIKAEAVAGVFKSMKEAQDKWGTPSGAGIRAAYAQLQMLTGAKHGEPIADQLKKIWKAIELHPERRARILEVAQAIGYSNELARIGELSDEKREEALKRIGVLLDSQTSKLDESAQLSKRIGGAWDNIQNQLASALTDVFNPFKEMLAETLDALSGLSAGKTSLDSGRSAAGNVGAHMMAAGLTGAIMAQPGLPVFTSMAAAAGGGIVNKNFNISIHGTVMQELVQKIQEVINKAVSDAEYERQAT